MDNAGREASFLVRALVLRRAHGRPFFVARAATRYNRRRRQNSQHTQPKGIQKSAGQSPPVFQRRSRGEPLKPLTEAILERRATNSFKPDEDVPEEYLNAILQFGAQAPSGYNLQPWRFIVVRDEANRKRLQSVAYNQPKVGQAPVVVIAVGMKEEWKERAGEVSRKARSAGRASGRRSRSTSRARSVFSRRCRWTCGLIATR